MRLRYVFTILLLFVMSITCFGQQNTAKFKDGTAIDYELVEKNPDNMNQFNISLLSGLNFTYFKPNSFFVTAKYGIWRYGAEGLIFFKSFEQEKEKNYSIKSISTGYREITSYVIKPVVTVKTYVGVHTGYYRLDYTNPWSMNIGILKTNEVFAGLGLSRMRFSKILVNYGDKPTMLKATLQTNFYADILYFPGRKYFPNEEESIDPTLPEYSSVNEFSKEVGYRVYFDGKASIARTKDFGLTWKLGYQSGPYTGKSAKLGVLMAFGFYCGF